MSDLEYHQVFVSGILARSFPDHGMKKGTF